MGTNAHMHRFLGAHRTGAVGAEAVAFGLWAPAAQQVSVLGDMTGWEEVPLSPRDGIWEVTVPGGQVGDAYHYRIYSSSGVVDKADPYGTWWQVAPRATHSPLVG